MSIREVESENWQRKLGTVGVIVQDLADIDQCIGTILTTPRGSVPHEPEFGCDLDLYVDHPDDVARQRIQVEVRRALTLWEPRIRVVSIDIVSQMARANIYVRWEPVESPGAGLQTTEVTP